MSHAAPFKAATRQTWYLTAFTLFSAGVLIACGEREEGEFPKRDGIQSIRSALTYTVPYRYNKGIPFFTATGVECYQSGYDYVCAVNLHQAHVRTVHGTKIAPQSFELHTVWDYWNSAPASDPVWGGRKVIAVNTSFFDYHPFSTSPREISFPYKQNGTLLTKGTDCSGGGGKIKNLHVWNDRQYAATGGMGCSSTDFAALESYGSAPDIIGGLDTSFPKRWSDSIGRTYFGVKDGDREGYGFRELLFIYSSASADQDHAPQQLWDFGADEVMMFDGSGSSQLVINGAQKVSDPRLLPNALVVYAAP